MTDAEREKAIELHNAGMGYKRIGKELGISYKTIESYILRQKRINGIQPKEINIKDSILKDIEKECAISFLCDKYKISERVLNATLEDIKEEGYNVFQLDNKVKLMKIAEPEENVHTKEWKGNKIIKFGVVSDTHICNRWQQLTFLNHLYDLFESEGIKTVYHAGDISDGYYKNRPGHIYELIDGMAGADAQAEYIIKKYPYREGITTEFITGNHDATHIMNGGANIGRAIARERKDMVYLGCDNAKVYLTPNCILEINHPADGAAYALSYTLQKLIDSMSGGEKPHILLNGHHHKAMYLFYRNIHAFEAGTIEAQTPFMKGKKIAANIGGWIITAEVDKEGTITRCDGEFIPLYKPLLNDWR